MDIGIWFDFPLRYKSNQIPKSGLIFRYKLNQIPKRKNINNNNKGE